MRRSPVAAVAVIGVFLVSLPGSASGDRGGNGSGQGQQPPVNQTSPSISGNAQAANTLSADPGAWTGVALKYAYQWARCDSNGGSCAAVGGATSSTYSLASSDVGATMRVLVTASNQNGSASATSAPTPDIVAVAAPSTTTATTTNTATSTSTTTTATTTTSTTSATSTTTTASTTTTTAAATSPSNTSPPIIAGTPQQGQTLTVSNGSWSGTTPLTYSYQWQRCDSSGAPCSAISGAIGTSYLVLSSDIGFILRAAVTANNTAGSATSTSTATTVVVGTTSSVSTYSASRYVYCLGDPGWLYDNSAGGWWYDGTSTGWIRQGYAGTLSQRVTFDDSVTVMQSVTGSYGQPGTNGPCHTVKAVIQPQDSDANGGTSNQRAQVYAPDSNLTKTFYGSQPPLSPKAGQTSWYGFAFNTNTGYTPHYDPTFGNFNTIFTWHNAPVNGVWGPLANIALEVATIGPTSGAAQWSCGTALGRLAQPRLSIEINGGNQSDTNWPNEDGQFTCRRYLGPTFQPGHLYRVQMLVTWDAYMHGSLQIWIDGTKYVDATGISNVWYSGSTVDSGIYPIFENYRYYDTSLPTNIVYYGGLIKGSTQTDVAIP